MIAAVIMSAECRVQGAEAAFYPEPGIWNLELRGK